MNIKTKKYTNLASFICIRSEKVYEAYFQCSGKIGCVEIQLKTYDPRPPFPVFTLQIGTMELTQIDFPISVIHSHSNNPKLYVEIPFNAEEKLFFRQDADNIIEVRLWLLETIGRPLQNIDYAMSIVYWNNARSMTQKEFSKWVTELK